MSTPLFNHFTVSGAAAALKPNAVKAFRHNGLLIVRDFFQPNVLCNLSRVCKLTALARGEKVYPGVDRGPSQQKVQVKPQPYMSPNSPHSPQMSKNLPQPTSNASANNYTVQVNLQNKQSSHIQGAQGKKMQYVQMNFPLKTQKKVDKLYHRLMRRRDKYYQSKSVKDYLTLQEKSTGKVSNERMDQIAGQIEESQRIESQNELHNSSKVEKQICVRSHINDTIEILQNFGKAWNHVWLDSTELTQLITNEVGPQVGKVAEALSGEVVIRLFSDFIQESHAFTNASPFSVFGQMNNFSSSTALVAIIGLTNHNIQSCNEESTCLPKCSKNRVRYAVLPGSHVIMRQITKHGQDYSRLSPLFIFDTGRNVRSLPELHHLPMTQFTVDTNTVAFINVLTLMASFPMMMGSAASPFIQLPARRASCPDLYALSLMPDRCTFDGVRRGWHAADSHGPLYSYEKGQLLNDNRVFPVLYRGLDIE